MTNRIVELKERVYEFVSANGPALPASVAKEFKSTNLFMSALLSELVTNKRLFLTKAKVGGSPLYYCKSQEHKLAQLLRNYLNPTERNALDILQEKKVLRDRDCLPAERVALRQLYDFAKPVRLMVQGTEELFWVWYLVSEDQAKSIIELSLESLYPSKEDQKSETVIVPRPEQLIEVVQEHKGQDEVVTTQEPEKKVRKKHLAQTQLVEKKAPLDFERLLFEFLKKKEMTVLEKRVIRRNREWNLIVEISSSVGRLRYFVKVKNRKSVNEGDVVLAFTESQNMKLPLLFISSVDFSKKAQDFLAKNFPGIQVIRVKN